MAQWRRTAVLVAAAALIATSSPLSVRAQEAGCAGVPVVPGADIQGLVDASPEGTTFCLLSGTHRITKPIRPRNGDSFVGVPGAALSGAVVLTPQPVALDRWVAEVPLHVDPADAVCADGESLCGLVHRVWVGSEKLEPVENVSEVGPGTYHADIEANLITLGAIPLGPVEMSTASLAITGQVGSAKTNDVTVRDLVIERFANQRRGAISAFGGSGWVIENNEVRDNHGCGIGAGPGAMVRGNNVHHNGQIGMCGQGAGISIVDNEIAFNNTDGFDSRWEGGGSKWVNTTDLVVRGNSVHDNEGPGLWTDWNNTGTLYENNVVERNAGEGIFHEASFKAVIRKNTVRDNDFRRHGPWGAGIMVSSSTGVRVVRNTVVDNTNGIVLVHVDRGMIGSRPAVLRRVTVARNTIVTEDGYSGFWSATGEGFDESLRYSRNRYHLLDGKNRFMWLREVGLSAKEWRAASSETGATFSVTSPAEPSP